jgi:hypothetical protein
MSFEQDLADLARIIQRQRPGWAESAVRARLRVLAESGCSAGEALDAGLRAAADPGALTPVMMTDPKYRTPVASDDGREPRCEDHPTMRARRCPACLGDVKAGMRDPEAVGRRLSVPQESGRAITPEERERLREWALRAAEGMQDDAAPVQGTEQTA